MPRIPTKPAATAPVGFRAPPVEVLVEADAADADEADCELPDVVEPDPAVPESDDDMELLVELCVDDV